MSLHALDGTPCHECWPHGSLCSALARAERAVVDRRGLLIAVAAATGRTFIPPERNTDADVVVDAVRATREKGEKAEASCAVLRDALTDAREEIHAAYGEYDANIDAALATDAGKGYLSPAEAASLREQVQAQEKRADEAVDELETELKRRVAAKLAKGGA